jgi:MMP 1-O-methyltransferase
VNVLRRILRRDRPWIDEAVPGWMTRPELEAIARVAAAVPRDGVIVEIGSFAGRSSVHWAANSHPSVAIFCIDPFDAIVDEFSFAHLQGDPAGVQGRRSGELFAEHTRPWADRLTALAQPSPPPDWDRPADVIFVDGDHSFEGVTRDLEFWIAHLKPGGRLLGHDWDDARVREAVEGFAARQGLRARPHPGTCMWELERPAAKRP